jgi:hypothetical protein
MQEARATVVPNEIEAELACSALREHGIACLQRRTSLAGLDWGEVNVGSAGGREVIVDAEDLARAKEVLATLHSEEQAPDEATIDADEDAEFEYLRRRAMRTRQLFAATVLFVFVAPLGLWALDQFTTSTP